EIRSLLPRATFIPGSTLATDTERILRAQIVVLVVSGVELLSPDMLERVGALLGSRPRNSVAVVVGEMEKLGREGLQGLERRAWKTLVSNPPSNTSRAKLTEYGVFLAGIGGNGELSERLANDRDALTQWFALPRPSHETLDGIFLRRLAAQLH